MRLKDTNHSIIPQDVHRPPRGYDVPNTTLKYSNIRDHLVLHVDEYNSCGIWVSDPIRRIRGKNVR